jgi:hypothetical protein
MARSHEQRTTPRIQPFVVPCRIIAEPRRLECFLVELSVRGARISSEEEAPPVGSRAVLEVRLGRQVAHSRLTVEVKWVRFTKAGRHDFGVTFVDVAPDDQKLLDGVVEEFRQRASQLA